LAVLEGFWLVEGTTGLGKGSDGCETFGLAKSAGWRMPRLGGVTDTSSMPDYPPCEYVDVALYFQQMIRERGADLGSPATVAIGEACGQPSVGASRAGGGSVEHFCDLHLRQPNLVRG
jgi:hypothetical protein